MGRKMGQSSAHRLRFLFAVPGRQGIGRPESRRRQHPGAPGRRRFSPGPQPGMDKDHTLWARQDGVVMLGAPGPEAPAPQRIRGAEGVLTSWSDADSQTAELLYA